MAKQIIQGPPKGVASKNARSPTRVKATNIYSEDAEDEDEHEAASPLTYEATARQVLKRKLNLLGFFVSEKELEKAVATLLKIMGERHQSPHTARLMKKQAVMRQRGAPKRGGYFGGSAIKLKRPELDATIEKIDFAMVKRILGNTIFNKYVNMYNLRRRSTLRKGDNYLETSISAQTVNRKQGNVSANLGDTTMHKEAPFDYVRPYPITYVGTLDPQHALTLIEEYFAEVSDQELYEDLLEAAPELIDYFGFEKP